MSVKSSRLIATVFFYGILFCFSYVAVAATVNQRVTIPAVEANNNNSNGGVNDPTTNTVNENTNIDNNTNVNVPNTVNTNLDTNAPINNKNTNEPNTNNTNNTNNENSNNSNKNTNDSTNKNGNKNTNKNRNTNVNVPNTVNLEVNTNTSEPPAGQLPSVSGFIETIQASAAVFAQRHPVLQQTSDFIQSSPGKIFTASAGLTGVLSWSALATSQVVGASVTVTSLADLLTIVMRFFAALFGLSRRKRQHWGTVYDAVTKRPLDPAYVLAQTTTGKEMTESFTDLDGRYGFLLPAGTYIVTAQKTHYAFPSKNLAGRSRDELYDNLYFGEHITAQSNEVITRNIPLDPIDFDWNEFEKNQEHQFRFYSQRRKTFYTISLVLYTIGFASSLLSLLLRPGIVNGLSLVVYIIILLYHVFWLPKRRAVTVQYASGRPLPFAIIRFYSAKLNKNVKSIVTNAHGQFYVLLEPSRYYITIEAKQADGSYVLVYRSATMELKKGIMTHSITIPDNWTEPVTSKPKPVISRRKG